MNFRDLFLNDQIVFDKRFNVKIRENSFQNWFLVMYPESMYLVNLKFRETIMWRFLEIFWPHCVGLLGVGVLAITKSALRFG